MAIGYACAHAFAYAAKKKKSTKKKKGKSKKKKLASKRGDLMAEILANYTEIPPETFVMDHLVTCHIRLLNWDYLDFDLKVSVHTKLFVIAQKIIERHGGSIERLQLWRDQVKPHLQLTDLTESLDEVFEFEEITPPPPQEDVAENDENAPPGANGEDAAGVEGAATEGEEGAQSAPEDAAAEDSEGTTKKKKAKGKRKKGKKKSTKKKKSVKKKKAVVEEVKPAAPVKPPMEFECVIYYDFLAHQSTCPLLSVEF